MLGCSGTSAGAASTAFGASLDPIATVAADEDAAATLTFGLAVVPAVAGAGAGPELLADNDVTGADGAGVADAGRTSGDVAVTTVDGGAASGGLAACRCACGIARAAVRAGASDLAAGGGVLAAAVPDAGTGAALTAVAGELTAAVLTVGAADGTAVSRTLVTMARAAIGVFCASAGRSTSDRTTPAPAVAPIAVATSTTRAVRAKLGAGARWPHSGLKFPAERIRISRFATPSAPRKTRASLLEPHFALRKSAGASTRFRCRFSMA